MQLWVLHSAKGNESLVGLYEIVMKRLRAHKNYPTWRQRDTRMLLYSLAVGSIAAAVTGALIYLTNRVH